MTEIVLIMMILFFVLLFIGLNAYILHKREEK